LVRIPVVDESVAGLFTLELVFHHFGSSAGTMSWQSLSSRVQTVQPIMQVLIMRWCDNLAGDGVKTNECI
jgi:hypothetical protein